MQQLLDDASEGEVVSIGACRVQGPLIVPAGVTLEGEGAENTVIVAPADGVAVELAGSLSSLAIESDGCAGVIARDASAASIVDVEVRADRGVGIAVEDVTGLELTRVQVIGPVEAASADDTVPPLPPFSCGSSSLATHGIVLAGSSATLTSVDVSGFAAFGALAIASTTTWRGGSIETILGAGIEVWGGSAALEDLAIRDVGDGAGSIEAFGGVFGGGAIVTSRGLIVEDGDGYGLFQDGGSASHVDLTLRANGFAGAWAQSAASFEIDGASSALDNGFAGVAMLDSQGVLLRGATISRTLERARLMGLRTVRAADGVHSIASEGRLEGLDLAGNARAGLLLELGGASTATVALSAITVDASGTALGAVAQNGSVLSGWDAEIVRLGAAAANDALFTGSLDIAGAVGPPCFPPIDDVRASGIGALVGP